MNLLEKALEIAVRAHRGQQDRVGQPYVLHPLRMMCRMETDAERMVALLHDVVEDTDWTLEQLRGEGFPESIVVAVDALTRRDGESYEDFVRRAAGNTLARRVKFADLQDNMDARRLGEFSEKDRDRFARYVWAWNYLKNLDTEGSARVSGD